MKTINLLSAFSICSLLIFSAKGMENDGRGAPDLAKSTRIITSKTEKKGWFATVTDYVSGYKNNTDKALNAYLNLDKIPQNHLPAATDYTHWAMEDETAKLSINISEIPPFLQKKASFPAKAFSEIIERTSRLEKLIAGANSHDLVLSQNIKTKSCNMLSNVRDIMPLLTAAIAQQSLDLCKTITDIGKAITPGVRIPIVGKNAFLDQVRKQVISPYQQRKKHKQLKN